MEEASRYYAKDLKPKGGEALARFTPRPNFEGDMEKRAAAYECDYAVVISGADWCREM